MSAVDYPAVAQTTCIRSMPLDHKLAARGSIAGDLAVDVDMEAAVAANIEPVGPADSEEAASIVHVAETCYPEASVEAEASANLQVPAWVQPEAVEAVDIPVALFVYSVPGNDLARPLLQVWPAFPAGRVLDTARPVVGSRSGRHTSAREVSGRKCVESWWVWTNMASLCRTAHRTGCHLLAR